MPNGFYRLTQDITLNGKKIYHKGQLVYLYWDREYETYFIQNNDDLIISIEKDDLSSFVKKTKDIFEIDEAYCKDAKRVRLNYREFERGTARIAYSIVFFVATLLAGLATGNESLKYVSFVFSILFGIMGIISAIILDRKNISADRKLDVLSEEYDKKYEALEDIADIEEVSEDDKNGFNSVLLGKLNPFETIKKVSEDLSFTGKFVDYNGLELFETDKETTKLKDD